MPQKLTRRNCVAQVFCYDANHEERIRHVVTHGPHFFDKTLAPKWKKFISVTELMWAIGTFAFALFSLIYSFVSCAFWAKLVYFTNWGLIVSNFYFLIRLISNLYNRHTQKYLFLLWDPKWDYPTKDKKIEKPERIPTFGVFLWGITMQLQLVAFTWETFILGLYFTAGGDEIVLDLISVTCHLILPILLWVDIWASGIPFPVEHTYKIAFYGSLYPMFGQIHYFNNWGHFTNVGACADAYYNSITLGQFWVYSGFNFANNITYVQIFVMVCFVLPAFGFIVYFFKKCCEDDIEDGNV